MRGLFTSDRAPDSGRPESASDTARVQPVLADLLAQAGRANVLPPLAKPARARQQGLFNAPLKGRGMEYAESRPYQPGDDVRALDWRLTARSGKPHTKLFREERERPVLIAVDLRSAMAFATHGVFKSVQAARTAAMLAFKAAQSGDRVGGLVLGPDRLDDMLPARGQMAVTRLLKKMVATGMAAESDALSLNTLSERLLRLTAPGSLVFVLSDFRDLDEAAQQALARVAGKSQLHLIEIHDAFEASLPTLQAPLRVTRGAQSAEIELGNRVLSRAYQARYAQRQAALTHFCRAHRAALTSLSTTDDPLTELRKAAS